MDYPYPPNTPNTTVIPYPYYYQPWPIPNQYPTYIYNNDPILVHMLEILTKRVDELERQLNGKEPR